MQHKGVEETGNKSYFYFVSFIQHFFRSNFLTNQLVHYFVCATTFTCTYLQTGRQNNILSMNDLKEGQIRSVALQL